MAEPTTPTLAISPTGNSAACGDLQHQPDAASVAAIVNNPAYRPADRDLDLLAADATRGVRLQLEYQKAELRLTEYGIDHTIVVFGGARIEEPAAAAARLVAAQRDYDSDRHSPALQSRLSIAKRSQDNSRYYEIAREFGRLVGRSPNGDKKTRLFVMSGGGPGIMEAVHRGADEVGAKSVGLNIVLPSEQLPNPYVTPDLCFNFRYFALRKLHFLHRARALVAFPGGFGTLDELFETLTLVSTRKIAALPIILVGQSYWRRVIDIDFLVGEGLVTEREAKLFWYCETAEDIWQSIQSWHAEHGHALFNSRAE